MEFLLEDDAQDILTHEELRALQDKTGADREAALLGLIQRQNSLLRSVIEHGEEKIAKQRKICTILVEKAWGILKPEEQESAEEFFTELRARILE